MSGAVLDLVVVTSEEKRERGRLRSRPDRAGRARPRRLCGERRRGRLEVDVTGIVFMVVRRVE